MLYSFGPIHMEGVRFLVDSGATAYFGAPTVSLDKLKVIWLFQYHHAIGVVVVVPILAGEVMI